MTIEQIKNELKTTQYDFLRTNEKLGDNIILLGVGGSYAYGTNVENSDLDIRGIAYNSKEEILLGNDFKQVVDSDTDTTIFSFMKIMELLTNANPNVLEILALEPNQYLKITPIGQSLIDNKDMFLSKNVFYTFGGYARAQLRRLDNKTMRSLEQDDQEVYILNSIKNASSAFREKYFCFDDDAIKLYTDKAVADNLESEIFMDINLKHYPLRDYKGMWSEMNNIVKDYGNLGKRASNAILHSKVCKHAMHLVRLMNMCIEILETGKLQTYRTKDHDLLMSIRNGEYMGKDKQMVPEFFEMISKLEKRMNSAMENSFLPDKPDMKRIKEFIYDVNTKVVSGQVNTKELVK